MTRSALLLLLGLILPFPSHSQTPLIIDTDASFDVDDVLAICMAHALERRGEAKILAVMHDAGIPEGIGAVSVLNHYYGRDDIVLGAYKGEFGKYCDGSWVPGEYVYDLVNNFDSPVWNSDQVDEATVAYRKVLAAAEDNSVKIAAIGFPTNIRNLLESPADDISPLTGYDLVAAKVKTVVWQGGWYPPIHGWGAATFNWACGSGFYCEDNIYDHCYGAGEVGVNGMPPNVEMVYTDIGDEVIAGRDLSYCADYDNPCRVALEDQQGFGNGRCAWDLVAVLHAIRPDNRDYYSISGEGDGRCNVDFFGANTWQDGDISGHSWLTLNGAWDDDWGQVDNARRGLESVMDGLLCELPGGPTSGPPLEGGAIVNRGNSECLHVDGNGDFPNDYTNVITSGCNDGNNQKWAFNGAGQLIHTPSGMCLDMDANNNNLVEVYSCFGAEWQNWDRVGDTIVNAANGECLALDGSNAVVRGCDGSDGQNWDMP